VSARQARTKATSARSPGTKTQSWPSKARLCSLGHHGAGAGGGVEAGDAGAAGAQRLGQRALRDQLDLDLPGLVGLDRLGVRGEEGADGFAQLAVAQQPAAAQPRLPHVVADIGEVARARSASACSRWTGLPVMPKPPAISEAWAVGERRTRCSSWTRVVRMRAPEAPSGCPNATAPPWTFVRSWIEAELADHGERLRGERLVELDQVEVADVEADPLRAGAVAGRPRAPSGAGRCRRPRRRAHVASGRRPRARAVAARISSSAAAPSFMPLELPAVTLPPSRNAGFSRASCFGEVSSTGVSVALVARVLVVAHLGGAARVRTGTGRSPRRRRRRSARDRAPVALEGERVLIGCA
jgi:hypothetical protein